MLRFWQMTSELLTGVLNVTALTVPCRSPFRPNVFVR